LWVKSGIIPHEHDQGDLDGELCDALLTGSIWPKADRQPSGCVYARADIRIGVDIVMA
jgi:hypothetical protein